MTLTVLNIILYKFPCFIPNMVRSCNTIKPNMISDSNSNHANYTNTLSHSLINLFDQYEGKSIEKVTEYSWIELMKEMPLPSKISSWGPLLGSTNDLIGRYGLVTAIGMFGLFLVFGEPLTATSVNDCEVGATGPFCNLYPEGTMFSWNELNKNIHLSHTG